MVYERLASSGMTTVHHAKKRGISGFEHVVALKRMLPHLTEDAEFTSSFAHAAKIASLLAHPNIAQIYDFGRVGSVCYLAMEYVEGIDVRKMLWYSNRHKEPLPLSVVMSVLYELCDALEYAHTLIDEHGQPLGIVHGDVAPSNLILAQGGHLKVLDFGSATAHLRQLHTESGRISRKLGYMSPEAVAGRAVLPVSDVFSAGVIAHELLTAHPLFSAKTQQETLVRIYEAEISPPSRHNPSVPAALDEVVLAALARDPKRRLQTAGAFRTALEHSAKQLGVRFSASDVAEWRASVEPPGDPWAAHLRLRRVSSSAVSRPAPFPASRSSPPAPYHLQPPEAPPPPPRSGLIAGLSSELPPDDETSVAELIWGSVASPGPMYEFLDPRAPHPTPPPSPLPMATPPLGAQVQAQRRNFGIPYVRTAPWQFGSGSARRNHGGFSMEEAAADRTARRRPRVGEVIDDRFVIEHFAGAGGMGQVYRARDRSSGGLVALKVMRDAETLEVERFAREAHVTATLSHPGVVRYIHSGITAEGEPYLVMEWLSGETLSARLHRTQLTLAECLALGRRVASALSAIHRRGIVHRDLKPSNVFLRGNAIDEAVLIDFGMARRPTVDPKLTVTGAMVGTPGYIAPEQVNNAPNLDGRADIFSLGCVLYRCLAGRAPFYGPDALRMLFDGATYLRPRLREFHPSIPHQLDDLVARMLSRSPEDRPRNGDVVAAELLAIEESGPSPLVVRPGPRSVLSEIIVSERRLMCLVVARSHDKRSGRPVPVAEREGQERALRAVVEHHRGRLEIFADGTLLVILSNTDAMTDLARRGARCALAIQPLLGKCSVVVVSGRAVLGSDLFESELLDRSIDLLESTAKGATIRIDELTAALLKDRFDTGRTGRHLRGELRASDRVHFLVGEPAVCVGRDQELGQLEAIFDQCAEERAARMVLVTGAAGSGKSRLGHAFLHRLRARGQAMAIWFGEADALNAGSAFDLLAQLIRGALGLIEGESIDVRREKILAGVARNPDGGGTEFAEVLGDLVGTPFEREANAECGAAPDEPMRLREQLGQCFQRLLGAACAAQPVVLVLEDLHWGDLPTINLLDKALGALFDHPLMVLALARTEVYERFPRLWADRRVQEIRVPKLPRRASEQLVRQVLGAALEDKTLKVLVERSEGHAFYLDEMIRAVAEGKGTTTPQAVLVMVQAQIEKLDPAARRVLRAASIFGETFWRGGVEALLGGGDTAAWLAELAEQDVIAVKAEARFPAEVEYRFRQALVREAAYGMLTEGDMVAGHWLAGQWLEQVGETNTSILEEHFERCGRGGEPGSRA